MKSIADSPAWKALFDAKPNLRQGLYNIILCLSTDGVNPFRSGQHSCWPVVFKVLNLPPELSSRTDLLVLAAVVHGPRKPKTFQAYNLMIADELLDLREGVKTTSPDGRVTVTFTGELANHSCDLPANGLVTEQQTTGAKWGCLKCLIAGRTKHNRQVYGMARRYLPDDHPYRTDTTFGDAEIRPPPAKRTLADTVNAATFAQTQRDRGAAPKAYTDRSKGVRGNCELTRLGYDYVLNSLWDIVHVLKELVKKVRFALLYLYIRARIIAGPYTVRIRTVYGSCTYIHTYVLVTAGHSLQILNMMKGNRKVKDPSKASGKRARKSRKSGPSPQGSDASDEAQQAFAQAVGEASLFVRTRKQQAAADHNYATSPWPPGDIRRNVRPFQHTGSMNIHDLERYIRPRGPGLYHLASTELGSDQLQLMADYFWAVSLLLRKEVDVADMKRKRTRWVEILCRAERDLPEPEGSALINHALFEIWDSVMYWGPVYVTWMYIFERMMGQLCRKITDRASPEQSMTINWALASSLAWVRPRMSRRLAQEVSSSTGSSANKSVGRITRHLARLVTPGVNTTRYRLCMCFNVSFIPRITHASSTHRPRIVHGSSTYRPLHFQVIPRWPSCL